MRHAVYAAPSPQGRGLAKPIGVHPTAAGACPAGRRSQSSADVAVRLAQVLVCATADDAAFSRRGWRICT